MDIIKIFFDKLEACESTCNEFPFNYAFENHKEDIDNEKKELIMKI